MLYVILLAETPVDSTCDFTCLFLYSGCFSLLQSLDMYSTVFSLSLHILHFTSPCCLPILTLIAVVLSACSCATISFIPSVVFLLFFLLLRRILLLLIIIFVIVIIIDFGSLFYNFNPFLLLCSPPVVKIPRSKT